MMPTLSLTPGLQGECTGAIKLKKLEKILIAVYDEYCNKPDASCSISILIRLCSLRCCFSCRELSGYSRCSPGLTP